MDIVIVDDDDDWLRLISEYLTRAGCVVRPHAAASEALVAIAAQVPDIVITDLAMTPIDGAELARRISAAPATKGLPLIAMSGEVEPEWGVMRWFDAYLRKPADLSLAADLVMQLAQQRRADSDVARKSRG